MDQLSFKMLETVRKVPVPDHVYDYVLDLARIFCLWSKGGRSENWVKDLIDWGPDQELVSTNLGPSKGITEWTLCRES